MGPSAFASAARSSVMWSLRLPLHDRGDYGAQPEGLPAGSSTQWPPLSSWSSSTPSWSWSPNARNECRMLALMVSALAGSFGSRNAPDASLNQLATSTETVKFEVAGPTVMGVGNSIWISASAFDVKVKAWAVPPAGVNV